MRSANYDRHRALYLRERAKLTQAQLAAKVGEHLGRSLHPSSISLLEHGKFEPSFEIAEAICKALGVGEEELIRPKEAAA